MRQGTFRRPLLSLAVAALAAAAVFPLGAQPIGPVEATTFPITAGGIVNTVNAPPAAPVIVPTPRSRLYALDCGRIRMPDMGMFSDTGEYDGKPGQVVTPCFVVAHPKGTLLWDTGLSDNLVGKGPISAEGGAVLQTDRSLQAQLTMIGITKIDYLALSHLHFDHTGNASAFTNATWLINRKDMDAALAGPDAFINPADFRNGRQNRQTLLDGDHDVFGDGTVRILQAPGHTPGHQVLMVRLADSGPVILSGDLYHTRDNRRYQRVPTFNTSRAETLASMNRIETLARNLNARVIIQHDPEEFAALPRAPQYLE